MVTINSVYISGPMSGLPEHNFPAFHAAAKDLRARGYNVVNPAEVNPEPGFSWEYYLRKDLAELVKCEAIYLLPGWANSKGAKLELHVAMQLGMRLLNPELV